MGAYGGVSHEVTTRYMRLVIFFLNYYWMIISFFFSRFWFYGWGNNAVVFNQMFLPLHLFYGIDFLLVPIRCQLIIAFFFPLEPLVLPLFHLLFGWKEFFSSSFKLFLSSNFSTLFHFFVYQPPPLHPFFTFILLLPYWLHSVHGSFRNKKMLYFSYLILFNGICSPFHFWTTINFFFFYQEK